MAKIDALAFIADLQTARDSALWAYGPDWIYNPSACAGRFELHSALRPKATISGTTCKTGAHGALPVAAFWPGGVIPHAKRMNVVPLDLSGQDQAITGVADVIGEMTRKALR